MSKYVYVKKYIKKLEGRWEDDPLIPPKGIRESITQYPELLGSSDKVLFFFLFPPFSHLFKIASFAYSSTPRGVITKLPFSVVLESKNRRQIFCFCNGSFWESFLLLNPTLRAIYSMAYIAFKGLRLNIYI